MTVAQNNLEVIVFAQVSIWVLEFGKNINHLVIVIFLLDELILHQSLLPQPPWPHLVSRHPKQAPLRPLVLLLQVSHAVLHYNLKSTQLLLNLDQSNESQYYNLFRERPFKLHFRDLLEKTFIDIFLLEVINSLIRHFVGVGKEHYKRVLLVLVRNSSSDGQNFVEISNCEVYLCVVADDLAHE